MLKRLGFKNVLRIGAFLLVLSGVTVGVVTYRDIDKTRNISEDGVVTQAQVTDKRTYKLNRRTPTSYFVDVSYVANNLTYTGSVVLDKDVWDQTPIGASISVQYAPQDPTYMFLEGKVPTVRGQLVQIIALVMAGLILFLVVEILPKGAEKYFPF